MIRIYRPKSPNILKFGQPSESEGEAETKDAISFYSDPANSGHKFRRMGARGVRIQKSYSIYSDKSVRKVLVKMTNGKCAYCESKITAIYNGDVEHFRPKAGYKNRSEEELSQMGYYWLAAEWENLLFACPFCNQTNSHEIFEDGTIKEIVLGKLNQFPLLSETYRLNRSHGSIYFSDQVSYKHAFDLEESERLLLKPCTDPDIERYFKYDDDGAIIPGDSLIGIEQRRAEESIRVYALHRLNLALSRKEKIIQIKAQIRRVEIAIINYNKYANNSDEERQWFQGIMREEMEILKKFKDSDQEYAGLARKIIDKYFHDSGFL